MTTTSPKLATPTLVVDIDGTLLRTDLLWEQVFVLLKTNPLKALLLPLYLCRGRAALKDWLAGAVSINAKYLPYRPEVLQLMAQHRERGASIVLASASHIDLVNSIAQEVGPIEHCFGTHTENLKGSAKLATLQKAQIHNFVYAGDSKADMVLWEASKEAILVNPPLGAQSRLEKLSIPVTVLKDRKSLWKLILKQLRVHQWVKNILLAVPLVAAHQVRQPGLALNAVLAFFSFSFLASFVYVFNDLVDLENDRRHRTKRARPFASGQLPLQYGLVLLPGLLLLSALAASQLPKGFIVFLPMYLIANIAYSFGLKKVIAIDVVILAGLYTLRILAGGGATGIPVSQWLLSFSTFFFFGLAMAKRYIEIVRMTGPGATSKSVRGRGYHAIDKEGVIAIGSASSLIAVMVLVLYLHSPTVYTLYSKPERLWLVAPILLYWSSRIWLLAHRGELHDDPVVFALKDRMSWIVGITTLATLWWAT